MNIKVGYIACSIALILGDSNELYAANSGQLVIINSLGLVVNGNLGATASNVKIEVSDSTGPCNTILSLPYNGVVTIPWNVGNVHSTSKCTNIVSVDISALKTLSGVVQYDSTANATPPVTATAPTTFLAPTAPITNIVLIITGNNSPAMINSATSWGSALGVAPTYLVSNGSISVTGIMGGVGAEGFAAEKVMLKYGVRPIIE